MARLTVKTEKPKPEEEQYQLPPLQNVSQDDRTAQTGLVVSTSNYFTRFVYHHFQALQQASCTVHLVGYTYIITHWVGASGRDTFIHMRF
jgi:hypothetical protein